MSTSDLLQRVTGSQQRVPMALCATEDVAGAPPQSINTTLTRFGEDYILNGSKSFVTLGAHAQWLIVVANSSSLPPRPADGVR